MDRGPGYSPRGRKQSDTAEGVTLPMEDWKA